MRIALLADIHGNALALEAVLADIARRGGVDAYWLLGDLCAIGYDPAGVLDQLSELPRKQFVRGNADRYVTSGDLPPPTPDDVRANPDLIPLFAEVVGSFNWTKGCLAGRGWLDWLVAIPLEQRLTLPDGTRVLLVHSAPGTDDGEGLNPSLSDDRLRAEIAGCDADLICVGHFHMAMDRTLDGIRVVNPGAVSNNFAPDLRAGYAILTADANGYDVQYHRAAYDIEAVQAAIRRSGNPGAPYQLRFTEGKIRASWMDRWDGVAHMVAVSA